MKYLYYFFERFKKQNLKKTISIYLSVLMIFLIFGMKGIAMTVLIIFTFFAGWWSKSIFQLVKDYRLTLRLNRVKFTHADYLALQKERDSIFNAYHDLKESRGGSRGVKSPRAASPTGTKIDHNQIEEMKLRFEQEEQGEYK